jgi:microcystin-dependent protein
MDNYLGELRVFSFGQIPRNWAACNGQTMSINQNQALFSLLGTQYGGDGVTTFKLPDLRGHAMLGFGNGGGGTYPVGATGGTETVQLTTQTMPAHNHLMQVVNAIGSQGLNNADDYLAGIGANIGNPPALALVNAYATQATSATTLHPNSITNTGGSAPHENRMPYLAMSVCIALTGIYPSRP